MDVSVIIPSYNTQGCLANTLALITEQIPSGIQCETLVIDCSEHDQVKEITEEFRSVKFHHESTRFNPGIGRNIGAKLAQGALLIFIDADVALQPKAIGNAWAHYKEGFEVFGGALELNPDTSVGASSYLEHYFFNHESQALRPPQQRANLSSALMCFDKSLFLGEGGFKDIPRMQDTEFTERLRKKGVNLWYFPDVMGLQTQDSPLKKVLNKIYINGQNLYYIRYQPSITLAKKTAFFLTLPLLTAVKLARIFFRHMKYQTWHNKWKTLCTLPLLLLGGGYWMMGFYQAMIRESGISQHRD